jgi:hypothetical protein
LEIASDPRRSELFVDGQRIGLTPTNIDGLELGQRVTLELKKDGYETLRMAHIVGQNDDQLRRLELLKRKNKVYIDSQPRGARIYIDNRLIGETPSETQAYEDGTRLRIRVSREGYKDFSIRHRVGRRDDELSKITLQLEGAQSDEPQKVRVPMGF